MSGVYVRLNQVQALAELIFGLLLIRNSKHEIVVY